MSVMVMKSLNFSASNQNHYYGSVDTAYHQSSSGLWTLLYSVHLKFYDHIPYVFCTSQIAELLVHCILSPVLRTIKTNKVIFLIVYF